MTRFKFAPNIFPPHFFLLLLLSILAISCEQDSITGASDDEASFFSSDKFLLSESEGEVNMDEFTMCDCEYQVISVSIIPFNTTLPEGPAYDLYTTDLIGMINCAGTSSPCSGAQCEYFWAESRIEETCTLCPAKDPCFDQIIDDGTNPMFYPTQFYPFNCQMASGEQFKINWSPFWQEDDCVSTAVADIGSTITIRLRCSDIGTPDSECPGQAYYSQPIVMTKNSLSDLTLITDVKLGVENGCGCEPFEL